VIRSSLFTALIVLMSWTASSAQTGKPNPDTVKCYGVKELQYIAATLVEARACDTLLSTANAKLANRDTLIKEKDYEISQLNGQLVLKDKIIEVKEQEIKEINLHLEAAERHKKWLKFGWGSTSVILGGALVYFILN
jgi:hypothetical protein